MKRDNVITVQAAGNTVTTGAASANITIPTMTGGGKPLYVRVAATAESYIKLGSSGVTATTNDVLVQPADAVILAVGGHTNIAYIQGTATAKVNIIPLEDF